LDEIKRELVEEAEGEQEVCLEDNAYLSTEAALIANARGIDLQTSCTGPAPTLCFSGGALSDAIRGWCTSLTSTVVPLAWSANPIRHIVTKQFMSLLVVKDVVTDGAAHVMTTQWVHWDSPARFEGRLTELDDSDGIIYRLFC
jgi:hypothetical protein